MEANANETHTKQQLIHTETETFFQSHTTTENDEAAAGAAAFVTLLLV